MPPTPESAVGAAQQQGWVSGGGICLESVCKPPTDCSYSHSQQQEQRRRDVEKGPEAPVLRGKNRTKLSFQRVPQTTHESTSCEEVMTDVSRLLDLRREPQDPRSPAPHPP